MNIPKKQYSIILSLNKVYDISQRKVYSRNFNITLNLIRKLLHFYMIKFYSIFVVISATKPAVILKNSCLKHPFGWETSNPNQNSSCSKIQSKFTKFVPKYLVKVLDGKSREFYCFLF